ncbi:M23 family metallopeptidase [Agathobaculum sp. Marseille-P7918]|uniref:M23 family metallopeptidase n=1 Tax=Agathobaculum sp. Marseille-P7918 TaxID=2479843 RepID=UPI000F640C04|nr:M23 family metallopeptidase [Agathobaculum sp. Marseille-P7918]
MRNLLSFLFGLFSGLLYGLVRAILLLDRLIGLVYDLPLWPALGRAVRAAGQRRTVCAFAVFVPLFFVPGALLTQTGTMVYANDRPLGLVENPDTLSAAVSEIEQSASTLSDGAYTLPVSIETSTLRASESQFLTEDELKSDLIEASGELDTLAVISVNGEQAGVCRTAEDAQALLDRVKAQYTTAADENTDFLQTVRVDEVVAETDLVSDLSTLYAQLSPQLDVTSTRAVTYTESIPYETITRENDELDQTYCATIQEGSEGEAVVTAEIQTVDGQEHGRTIVERTVLSNATDEIIEVGTRNVGIGTGEFMVPLSSYTFTSGFKWRWGKLHSGVDLAVDEGTPVYAADNGKVIVAEDSGNGYGNYIILDHQNGYKTLYGHNSELLVSVGDIVAKGDKIALSGNTGNSTGPHLHFEIHVGDEKVDPQQYVALA